MQDLPLDTLLIIGLVIASFIGKLTKKKSSAPQPNPKKKEFEQEGSVEVGASLENVLREAWQNFSNPSQVDSPPKSVPETPLPFPVEKAKYEENLLAKKEASQANKKDEEPVFSYNQAVKKKKSLVSITEDLNKSNQSLRKAFLLKEILDEPRSIRKSSF